MSHAPGTSTLGWPKQTRSNKLFPRRVSPPSLSALMPNHKQPNELEAKQTKEGEYNPNIFGVDVGQEQFNNRQSDKHIYHQKQQGEENRRINW